MSLSFSLHCVGFHSSAAEKARPHGGKGTSPQEIASLTFRCWMRECKLRCTNTPPRDGALARELSTRDGTCRFKRIRQTHKERNAQGKKLPGKRYTERNCFL
uniref:Uncharacterized protein n=1 Tax=Toxoplasma gondii TgCATBr9 TaxID=943120 RepID=A0A2T6IW03_TOXGO|nr:hypothetical protein TGBR9_381930 [Toxoplasma gondii TgCATBr9]